MRSRCLPALVIPIVVAACVSPQQACENGLAEVKKRVEAIDGLSRRPDTDEMERDAHLAYLKAREAFREGNFEACVNRVEQADILFDRVKRLRFQDGT